MVKDELQIAREELKATRGELWVVRVKHQADKEELQKAFSTLKTYLSSPPPPYSGKPLYGGTPYALLSRFRFRLVPP